MENQKNNPKVLACTGGIGSGKTYISKIFEKMGIPVYYSDIETKSLYSKDKNLLSEILKLFGEKILINGELNRQALSSIIFNNESLKEKLEALVHPAVLSDFNNWKQDKDCKFVVFESAIILEKPFFKNLPDKILVVSAPLELRIQRVINRDNINKEQVLERISSQWTDKQRELMADFIIFADGNVQLLQEVLRIKQIMEKD